MNFQDLIQEVDESNHDKIIKNNFSVLHFFSDLEMNCLMALPMLESIAEEFAEKAFFGKINIEEVENLARKHKVSKVPSVLFFKKGSLVDRMDKLEEDLLRHKIMCLL